MRHPQHWYFSQFRCHMRKISAKRYRRAKLMTRLLWRWRYKLTQGLYKYVTLNSWWFGLNIWLSVNPPQTHVVHLILMSKWPGLKYVRWFICVVIDHSSIFHGWNMWLIRYSYWFILESSGRRTCFVLHPHTTDPTSKVHCCFLKASD